MSIIKEDQKRLDNIAKAYWYIRRDERDVGKRNGMN